MPSNRKLHGSHLTPCPPLLEERGTGGRGSRR